MLNLTSVAVQSCLLTSILSALEQLPYLRDVNIYDSSYRKGKILDGSLPQSVLSNPFPRLTSLTLQCSLEELCRYLTLAIGIAPDLRDFVIDMISESKPIVFQTSLSKIAEAFPLLKFLAITRKEDLEIFATQESVDIFRPLLSYHNLSPITKLCHLTTFKLECEFVVSMKNDQLCQLLSQCPSLVNVDLNQEPMLLSPTELTIDVLPLLARACPLLKDIGLYVEPNVDPTAPLFTFANLEYINLGISPLQNRRHVVAKLLAQVLPGDCHIVTERSFESDVEELFVVDPDSVEEREKRRREWAYVSIWMPTLQEACLETLKRAFKT